MGLGRRHATAAQSRPAGTSEQAALKCLDLVTRSLDPTGVGGARWMMRWKPALNAFAITFGDRFPAAEICLGVDYRSAAVPSPRSCDAVNRPVAYQSSVPLDKALTVPHQFSHV
jgi:hypothetical protein